MSGGSKVQTTRTEPWEQQKPFLERGFEIRVDTTFSDPTELYFNYEDTVYSVGLRNLESGGTDTLFVNVRDLSVYQAKCLRQTLNPRTTP